MDEGDGDNSSEGIVASSDDEVDGLSKAVENHISKQESATGRPARRSDDTDWREFGYNFSQLSYDESVRVCGGYLRTRPFEIRDYPLEQYDRSPPQHPFSVARLSSHRGMDPERYRIHDGYAFRRDLSVRGRSPPPHLFSSPPRDYFALRHEVIQERYKAGGPMPHLPPSARVRRNSPSPTRHSRSRSPGGLPPRRVPSPGPPRPRIPPLVSHPRRLSPSSHFPLRARHTQKIDSYSHDMFSHTDRHRSYERFQNAPQPLEQQRDEIYRPASMLPTTNAPPPQLPHAHFPSPPRSEACNLDTEPSRPIVEKHHKKSPPKPISFQIKAKPPSELPKRHRHPLDPFSSSPSVMSNKNSSPKKWSHDKYEELSDSAPKSRSKTPEQSSRNAEVSKRKRSRSGAGSSTAHDKERKHELTSDKKPKIERVYDEDSPKQNESDKQYSKEKQSAPQMDSDEEGLIHSQREEDTVYEEEEVIVLDDDDADANSPSFVEEPDSEDELLDLRLRALTSTLKMENPAKLGKVDRAKKVSKRKKPKRLIRRVHDTPLRGKSKRKSQVVDEFMKRYRSFSKHRSPERPRYLQPKTLQQTTKPSASQLTLVGEIIKNHQPPPEETLRLIRSMPDEEKKTEMFLKLMKQDQSATTDVLKEIFITKSDQPEKQEAKKEEENGEETPKHADLDCDNYDEIEMDLEDEGSDRDLVPPGTDAAPIAPPLLPSDRHGSPYSPTKGIYTQSEASKTDSPVGRLAPEMPIPATPTQESIWSMIERPVEPDMKKTEVVGKENEKEVTNADGEDIEENEGRPRIPSEEADFDDDALLQLRAKLLSQLDKQKEMKNDFPLDNKMDEFGDGPPGVSDEDTPPLPSQFPYQPPTMSRELQRRSPTTVSIATTPATVTTTHTESQKVEDFEFNEPVSGNLDMPTVTSVSQAGVTTATSKTVEVVQSPIVPVPISSSMNPITPIAALGNVGPSNLVNSGLKVFRPQMASTPDISANQTPLSVKVPTKRQRRRRRSRNKKAKAAANAQGNVAKPQENAQNTVLKPSVTNTATPVKTVRSVSLKTRPKANIFNVQTKTVVKTATTLIKTNAAIQKRPTRNLSPNIVTRKTSTAQKVSLEKPPQMRLPRHQPVVINLGGSSDEEDSILSPDKRQSTAKNPQDIHKDMLHAMIRQVRQQTTAIQKTRSVQDKVSVNLSDKKHQPSGDENGETSWPFGASQKVSSLMEKGFSLERQKKSIDTNVIKNMDTEKPKNIQDVARNEENAKIILPPVERKFGSKKEKIQAARDATSSQINLTTQKLTPTTLKSMTRQQKSETSQPINPEVKELKQCQAKFLKLQALIGKDKLSYKRNAKLKETKKAELKTVENELKEMMYRVAAIKGKKARCEELFNRYSQQEEKIKERLMKRNVLKNKLKEQIKQQYVKVRGQRRTRKIAAEPMTPGIQNAKVTASSSNPSSPSKTKKHELLDKEKQRLLAMQQELAAKINKLKKTDGAVTETRKSPRRASLSKEIQSHLAKYRKSRKSSNPSAHDLSLSKIAISALSPIRPAGQGHGILKASPSPAKKQLQTPPKMDRGASPKKTKTPEKPDTQENLPKTAKITSAPPQTDVPQVISNRESSAGNDGAQNLRQALQNTLSDMKQLVSSARLPFPEVPFSSKAWEKGVPECFKGWKLEASETPVSKRFEKSTKSYQFQDYKSPLRIFRSYRLNPFMRMKEKLAVKSKTFSHKIDTRKIFCRYDLTGTCQDPNCKAQHEKQYELSPMEVLFDLMSYCPLLLGKDVKQGMKYEDLIKITEASANKLCGITSAKNRMSVDEKCVLIASKVNGALGNKPPFTTVFRPKTLKPRQSKDSWKLPTSSQDDESGNEGNSEAFEDVSPQHPDFFIKDEERYFMEKDPKTLHKLEQAVKENPQNVQLWLELSNRKLRKQSNSEQNRLELALHTMCLALEENPYNGELWAHYLGLLHHRRGAQSDVDLHEMVSQAVELVPLSTHIWNQLLSWECSMLKREFLYDQLIANLIKNVEEENRLSELPLDVASRWLLQTVLQRLQLLLHRNSVEMVLPSLEGIVQNFSQQCKWAASERRCLTVNDLNSLWIAFINLKHFGSLPNAFLPDVRRNAMVMQCLGVKVTPGIEVCLQIESKIKPDDEKYKTIHADLNVAIEECTHANDTSHAACIPLLRERLRVERRQELWNNAIETCKILCQTLSGMMTAADEWTCFSTREMKELYTETTAIWADVLINTNDALEAVQVFDSAVTKFPSNAKICYEAALLQLNLGTPDVEAALLYFEACLSALLDTGKESLEIDELKNMCQHLLRLPMPLDTITPQLAKGVSWEDVAERKCYLWLIYCRILELSGDPNDAVLDSYEKAIDDVSAESDRKEIWLRYLRFKQTIGSRISSSGSQLTKARQAWFKNFTAVVRRCLSTVSPLLPQDEFLSLQENKFCDYTFHNQVASIYLSCFHTRQQLATAYNFLTEIMPYNVPLLLKACRFFLNYGDHHSVISTLWEVTSNTSCQSKAIWKM